jgi:spore coat polysaccharide biosynthesis protein SpsF
MANIGLRMKTAIFITVRTNSARLPQKCLLEVHGERVIEFLIRRLKRAKLADAIVLCTTACVEDDVLEDIARQEGILCFRGSERDKLERWRGAAEKFGIDFFVTADGDDPFCEPELIRLALKQFAKRGADFLQTEGLAVGAFTYGIKTAALETVCRIKDTDDTEMMWVYFTDSGRFRTEMLENVPDVFKRPEIRMTLDYPEDLLFFRAVIGHFRGEGRQDFNLRDVIAHLDLHPEIVKMNQHLNEIFLVNQKARTKLCLKSNT